LGNTQNVVILLHNQNVMRKALFFLLAIAVAQGASSQSKDETAVATAVESLRKAMVDGDKKALEDLAAPELSYGHSSGLVEDKTTFVENIASGKSDFVAIALTDQTIAITGNTAVVRHKLVGDTNNGGTPGKINLGVLLIWQKQKGEWKLLARHATRLNP
jgi:ketosteroid isomerase-like protein